MKKKLFFMCIIGLLSLASAYAKCDGGTEVTNRVGTTFCRSNKEMNWWSAAIWCKANGRTLATMYEMCPSWDGNIGEGRCSELNGIGNYIVWSATVSGSERSFSVFLSNGRVYNDDNYGNRTTSRYAFCR